MKRHGNLFEKIAAFENLLLAAKKAMRGKKDRSVVAKFCFYLEPELLKLEKELLAGTYRPRPYRTFMVYEPKPRKICAADIRDRVVHHAIFNIVDSIFESFCIADCYACLRGKGAHRAIQRTQTFSRQYPYFLKVDVEKFFDSVDHQRLKTLLRRKFKDRRLLDLFDTIIDHPVQGGTPGRGLPIGNLTSQYFANFYLAYLDHCIKNDLRVKGYVRYMDDMVFFSHDKTELHQHYVSARQYLKERLLLDFKERATMLAPVTQGIAFLGVRIFPGLIRLQRTGWTRFKRRLRHHERAYLSGELEEEAFVQTVQSLLGHLQHANTYHLRRNFFHQSITG